MENTFQSVQKACGYDKYLTEIICSNLKISIPQKPKFSEGFDYHRSKHIDLDLNNLDDSDEFLEMAKIGIQDSSFEEMYYVLDQGFVLLPKNVFSDLLDAMIKIVDSFDKALSVYEKSWFMSRQKEWAKSELIRIGTLEDWVKAYVQETITDSDFRDLALKQITKLIRSEISKP